MVGRVGAVLVLFELRGVGTSLEEDGKDICFKLWTG